MIVVDSSVAVKWLIEEDLTPEAENLGAAAAASRETLIAPPLLPMEVANVLHQRVRRSIMTFEAALQLFDEYLSVPIMLAFPAGLTRRALIIADQFRLPAVYDAHYIALAEYLGCDLWTADQRLLRALGGQLPFVRWIGDYRDS